MRLTIMLLLTTFALSAQSAVSGKWSGAVNYNDSSGTAAAGQQTVYLFPYSANHIYFADSFWGYQLDLEIQDGQLLLGGTPYGTITDNHIKLFYADDKCTWKLSMNIGDDGKLTYIDGYSCEDGYFDHTEGVLDSSTGGSFMPARTQKAIFRH